MCIGIPQLGLFLINGKQWKEHGKNEFYCGKAS
jgi:hypothetical protein